MSARTVSGKPLGERASSWTWCFSFGRRLQAAQRRLKSSQMNGTHPPLGPQPFGRKVRGADVVDILQSEELQTAVVQAFLTHDVLLWRGQQAMTPETEEALPWDDSVTMGDCSGPYDKAQQTGVVGVNGKASRWKLPAHHMFRCRAVATSTDIYARELACRI